MKAPRRSRSRSPRRDALTAAAARERLLGYFARITWALCLHALAACSDLDPIVGPRVVRTSARGAEAGATLADDGGSGIVAALAK